MISMFINSILQQKPLRLIGSIFSTPTAQTQNAREEKTTKEARSFEAIEGIDNTLLHDAIIDNDTTKAISLIHGTDDSSFINKKSLGNTALMLALKCGNIEVAKQLLAHPYINVDTRDDRGLTPLHWACMLRQDDIIQLLMNKGADPRVETKKWGKLSDSKDELGLPMTPENLYVSPVIYNNFCDFYRASMISRHETALWLDTYEHIGKESAFYIIFADSPKLYIPGAIAYTDIIFHMKTLCENLGWKAESTKFYSIEEAGYRTSEFFKLNFITGIGHFCKYRNAIPVNERIVALMKETHPKDELSPALQRRC
jgi:hypothetical protein